MNPTSSAGVIASLIAVLLRIARLAAFAVRFFSAMLYVRAMATRIGPLVALIMFWNLLNIFKTELKRIIRERADVTPGAGPAGRVAVA